MTTELTWHHLILGIKNDTICSNCIKRFELINGPTCEICSKPSTYDKCEDCMRWDDFYNGNDPLKKNISLYKYNEAMQDVITRWKYRGDYVLGNIFKEKLSSAYQKYFSNETDAITVVPIPLSRKRLHERLFNQSLMLAQLITPNVKDVFVRTDDEKQAKKSKRERMLTKNPFKLVKTINNSVVLVDDIYTTGRTIRHAAELLKKHGCTTVYSITLIRG